MRNDKLVQALTDQRDELMRQTQAIDDLLTHYLPIKEHAQPTKTYKRSPKPKKKASRGGPATKKTDQEIAAMGQMFEGGVPMGDICKKLNVSDGTVYKYARLNNWKRGKEDTP